MKGFGFLFAAFLFLTLHSVGEAQVLRESVPEERVFRAPGTAPFVSPWDLVPEEIRKKNSFKRFEWFYRSRLDEKGDFPREQIDRVKSAEMMRVKNRDGALRSPDSDAWTNVGPVGIDMAASFIPYWGTVSGRIRGIDVHPTNPNVVYIGAAAGGIWKTTNGGANWVDKSGDLNMLTFGSIAIDPSNTDVVYAGSGETMWLFNTTTFEGDGLYKSTNGGDNWTKITNGFGSQTQFSDIKVSPTNSNIILASLGTGNYNYQGVTNQGVWRSADAGVTWTRVINLTGAFDVAFHPTDGNFCYAVIGNKEATGGFFVSTDAGVTWTNSNTGLPGASSRGRIQFEVAASNPLIIYLLIYNTAAISVGRTSCAYKSVDGGTSWTQISPGVNIAGTYDGFNQNDQGNYDLCLTIHPTNPNNVFFGNVEISKTTNGSAISFVRNPGGYNGGVGAWACYTHVDIHRIMYAPSDANVMYVCCDGGIYKSTNGGTSFTHINNGINTLQFYRAASHPTNPSILYAGAQDNGNISTTNKGATSWGFESSGDGMECFVDYSNANNVFMSTQFGSLLRSTDAGVNWATVVLGEGSITAWTAPYWQHPTQPAKIYAAHTRKIKRSLDAGANWTDLTPANIITSNRITSVAHSTVNTNNMMLAASNFTLSPQVMYSVNEGANWTSVNFALSGFSGVMVHRVVADPVDANTFYIARASYTTGQVIKTTNLGTNWTNISGDLPAITVSDIFIDPLNASNIYVGNDFGVYLSTNGGVNYSKLSNGMPFVPVLDFSYYSFNGTRFLRAASHGRGIFELNLDAPLPVQLASFSSGVAGRDVRLNWSTSQELNNAGFEVQRAGIRQEATGNWERIGYVEGKGTTNEQTNYSFVDKKLGAGKYKYRLKQVDVNGNFEYFVLNGEVVVGVPERFSLGQNYPNPFNPVTSISYELPDAGDVVLKVFDVTGREVRTVVNERMPAGYHTVKFDARELSSGVYFYRLSVGVVSAVKRMVVVK
jgi:photosystem II stability/assembly factor-like uncharacterized protein